MNLKNIQSAFMTSLLKEGDVLQQLIIEQGNVDNATRVHIYQNAYQVRLKEVIEIDHELLAVYMGDNLFDQMTANYIEKHPSSFRSLRQFCDQLPSFLSAEKPFKQHQVLSELAAFERLLLAVFDAAEQDVIAFDGLLEIPEEQWPNLQLRFHPSVQLFSAHHNSVKIWQSLKNEQTPPDTKQDGEQFWLLWRNSELVTEFKSIDITDYTVITTFLQGGNFADCCEELTKYIPTEQVGEKAIRILKQLFDDGLATGFES